MLLSLHSPGPGHEHPWGRPVLPALQYIEGRGRLVDQHTVEVNGKRVTARNILVATGARAFVPKFEGSEHCIISDDALELPEVRVVGMRGALAGGGQHPSQPPPVYTCLQWAVHTA
jgi:glutathione reductase (NADPH)